MTKFLVKFKDGTELFVDAHMFQNNLDTGQQFRFFKSEKEPDNDVYVKTDEVLYIVAVGSADSDSK
jgi:hypothetical protein